MHKIFALLLPLILISLTGCEDKKPDNSIIPIENTTEVITRSENTTDRSDGKNMTPTEAFTPNISTDLPLTNTFMLLDTKSKSHKVTLAEDQLIFHRNTKPIVLINLFATWCTPCIGELAYLNILQKKYQKDLFLAGILTHDYIDVQSLKSFIAKHEIKYFISNSPHNNALGGLLARTLHLQENYSIPLMVMYVNGEYFTHYEGSVPHEMIEYDIQQAQKQLKLQSIKN